MRWPRTSCGTTSARARGPPVEEAIARHKRARPGTWERGMGAVSPRGGRARTGSRWMSATRAARRASMRRRTSHTRPGPPSSVVLATSSTAPSSSARIAASVPGPAYALTTTTGRGASDMMYPMAPRPSSSGISRSMVTMSGWYRCTLRSASSPFRAVATTWNSSESEMIFERNCRKKALSSTTRTDGVSEVGDIVTHRPDLDLSLADHKPDRAPKVTTDRFAADRDSLGAQDRPRGGEVPLTHRHGASLEQGGEHAGATC